MKPIHILVTMDENYIPPFQVMLTSLVLNNPEETFHIWLLHSAVSTDRLAELEVYCLSRGVTFHSVQVDGTLFAHAPVMRYYTQEMYYRLLAAHLLPKELTRVIYLDPDVLIINSIRPLWELDLKGNLFAAAAHTGMTEFANEVNRLRLGTDNDYFNTGVLLMDLDAARDQIIPDEIFSFARENSLELILPDQDIFNRLYGSHVLPLNDAMWNYDTRNYSSYLLRSKGEYDWEWVVDNTVVLHFCGSDKPWQPNYRPRLGLLYRHYMRLAGNTEDRS